MPKKVKSILEELENISTNYDKKYVIESRANNIITSAINLIDIIEETYSGIDAENLKRKFLNSIRDGDPSKFKRSLGRIDENK